MKRIFAIMAAVCLCCVLTIPALAANYNGTELPDIETVWTDKEKHPYAVLVRQGNGQCILFTANRILDVASSSLTLYGDSVAYKVVDDGWKVLARGQESTPLKRTFKSYVWVSEPLRDSNGVLVFDNPYVLSNSLDPNAFDSVLGEVISLLGIALPVVVGLFGIRKGIAFLLGRVRGA